MGLAFWRIKNEMKNIVQILTVRSLVFTMVIGIAQGFTVRWGASYFRTSFPSCFSRNSFRWLSVSECEGELPRPMENLYREWTVEQDQILWDNKGKTSAELASILGRGLRGVEARLSKLQDVSSQAYERLFTDETKKEFSEKEKLIPAGEVLRRIEWDYMLSACDFSVLYYDRMEDKTVESPVDAPNTSISGKETMLIKALPEHRIFGIKYKERIVWDRNGRIDLVFGDPGIYNIIETYSEWKAEVDRVQAWNRERQKAVAKQVKSILGLKLFEELQRLSSRLLQLQDDPTLSTKAEVERYVQQALELFRVVRNNPMESLDPLAIPMGDYYALDQLSELVAVLPNVELRERILSEIALAMDKVEGISRSKKSTQKEERAGKASIDLVEEELTETFVRGSGPGGQKINKTSNRVLLIHEPTQLRVECQETRSLQQNRKIARIRLKEKLDEHLNGSQSKLSIKQQKASNKKKKAKSKSRARVKKKKLEKQLMEQNPNSNDDAIDFEKL